MDKDIEALEKRVKELEEQVQRLAARVNVPATLPPVVAPVVTPSPFAPLWQPPYVVWSNSPVAVAQ